MRKKFEVFASDPADLFKLVILTALLVLLVCLRFWGPMENAVVRGYYTAICLLMWLLTASMVLFLLINPLEEYRNRFTNAQAAIWSSLWPIVVIASLAYLVLSALIGRMGIKVHKGTTRTVILVKQKAFKFPRPKKGNRWGCFLEGLLANRREADLGTLGFSQLCPVLFHIPGGWLTVMGRADPLPKEIWDRMNIKDFMLGVNSNNIDHEYFDGISPDLVEDKIDSFGIYRDRIVAVDYG